MQHVAQLELTVGQVFLRQAKEKMRLQLIPRLQLLDGHGPDVQGVYLFANRDHVSWLGTPTVVDLCRQPGRKQPLG